MTVRSLLELIEINLVGNCLPLSKHANTCILIFIGSSAGAVTSRVTTIFSSTANVLSGNRTDSVAGYTCAVSDAGFGLNGVNPVSPS